MLNMIFHRTKFCCHFTIFILHDLLETLAEGVYVFFQSQLICQLFLAGTRFFNPKSYFMILQLIRLMQKKKKNQMEYSQYDIYSFYSLCFYLLFTSYIQGVQVVCKDQYMMNNVLETLINWVPLVWDPQLYVSVL